MLGQILFLYYINDLLNVSNFKSFLLTTDANFYMNHPNIQTFKLLVNQEMNKVDEQLKNNKLTLNYKNKKITT